MSARRLRHGCRATSGFTLLELLCALAIIAILTVAAMPSLQSMLQAANLGQAGQTLSGEIDLARQLASTRNVTVEIRLLQLPSVDQPTVVYGYNAIQLFRPPNSGETPAPADNGMIPLGQRVILPRSVVISQDTSNYSKLLGSISNHDSSGAPAWPTPMAVPGGSAYYAAFHIMPSGSVQVMNGSVPVQPSGMTDLYLTVVPAIYGNQSAPPGSSGAPKNYALIQINPNTGTAQIFRP